MRVVTGYKHWCFVIFERDNNTPQYRELQKFRNPNVKYMICGLEKGKSGIHYIRGYLKTAKRYIKDDIEKILPFVIWTLEPCVVNITSYVHFIKNLNNIHEYQT